MASTSNNPPLPPLVTNEVPVHNATLVNAIPVNADAATPVAVTSSIATAKDISHLILEKITNSNYLLWCQQVEPVIKGHRLHYLLINPQIPL